MSFDDFDFDEDFFEPACSTTDIHNLPNRPTIQINRWILKILTRMNGHHNFIKPRCFASHAMAQYLGLDAWVALAGKPKFNKVAILKELTAKREELEQRQPLEKSYLSTNLKSLSKLITLDKTDKAILAFVICLRNDKFLDFACDYLGKLSTIEMFTVLSTILGIPGKDIRKSLHPKSILIRSGILMLNNGESALLTTHFCMLSKHFVSALYSSKCKTLMDLLSDSLHPCSTKSVLTLANYKHIEKDLSILQPYLKAVIKSRDKGVNILIHGRPGTGKTELAKVLAHNLHCDLFSVSAEDEDGDPINGTNRIRVYRAGQLFLLEQKTLILFDEIEDIFSDGIPFLGKKSTAQKCKAFVNQTLEDNLVPTIWISNDIESMDPAFIRRFDMVIKMTISPKPQRADFIRSACGDFLDDNTIDVIASSNVLAPAVVERAAKVVRAIHHEIGAEKTADTYQHLINETLIAQGHKAIHPYDPNKLPETYDPAFINCDNDLIAVTEGLKSVGTGRICLYGPPGTGKTAYGHWLSKELNTPLIIRRASDLIDKYIGESEKNIARAFARAKKDKAILLIDEVDSFLQDRRGANRSWEVSMVNEMLTQMEAFPGIFIASTNLMTGLDQAALRRFDLKVKFDFLNSHQVLGLFKSTCSFLNIAINDVEELKDKLHPLTNLTPGDFAAVSRQSRFKPIKSVDGLVAALTNECSLKEGYKKTRMGFIH